MMGGAKQWFVSAVIAFGCQGASSAQTDLTDLLKRGLADAALGLKPISEKEQDEILKVTAQMLSKKISFLPDGFASSVHYLPSGSATHVQWKDFKVTRITEQTVTEADRANYITKRYSVAFGCAASRTWDAKANRWTEWKPTGYTFFPSSAKVEEMAGKLVATLGEHGQFLKGGGAIQPANTHGNGLPPGMKRAGK